MNPTGLFVSALCGAAVTAAVVCTLMLPKTEEDTLQGDVASQLASIQKRLERMDESLAELKADAVTQKELRERTGGLVDQAALAELEKRIDGLSVTKSKTGNGPKDAPANDEVVADLIEKRLKIEEAKKATIARKLKEEGIRKWIQGSTKKYVAGLGKKLSLSQDQTDKLARVLEDNGLANVSDFGALKDESLSADDRLQSISNIRAGQEALETDARNILSTSQFEQFQQIRSEDPKSPLRWIDQVEESLRGGTSSGGGK